MLGCDLKLLGCDWLSAVLTLQKLAGVRGGELSVCYETVAPFYNMVAMQHPIYISPSNTTPPLPPQALVDNKEKGALAGTGGSHTHVIGSSDGEGVLASPNASGRDIMAAGTKEDSDSATLSTETTA